MSPIIRPVSLAAMILAGLLAGPAGADIAGPWGFEVDLSFSQAAASKLQALKEGVVIAAYYSGEPAAGAEEHADQIGMIDLGEDRTERDGEPAVVAIPGKGDIETRLHWVKDGEPLVNINVHSARRSGPDNLLDCDVYDGPLKAIAGSTTKIGCKLIGE